MAINVTIVEDHPLVIEGITNILNTTPHIKVMQCVAEGNALPEALEQFLPDILLLDMQLPDRPGSELAMYVRQNYPQVPILILSGLDSPVLVKNMLQIGCRGYLLKNTATKKTLTEAIETICYSEHDIYLDPILKNSLLDELIMVKKTAKEKIKLSKRESEILKLVADDYSNTAIAEKLYISLRTVENHKYNLFQKLNVKNSAGLIKIAMQMGLL